MYPTAGKHNLYVANLGQMILSNEKMLAAKMPYLPIYSGFILQMEGASQRPSREFDVDSVRNHCHGSILVIDGHLLNDSFDP